MTKGQFVGVLLIVLILCASQLFIRRYQTTSTNDTVYVVDTITGDIAAYHISSSNDGLRMRLLATRYKDTKVK